MRMVFYALLAAVALSLWVAAQAWWKLKSRADAGPSEALILRDLSGPAKFTALAFALAAATFLADLGARAGY